MAPIPKRSLSTSPTWGSEPYWRGEQASFYSDSPQEIRLLSHVTHRACMLFILSFFFCKFFWCFKSRARLWMASGTGRCVRPGGRRPAPALVRSSPAAASLSWRPQNAKTLSSKGWSSELELNVKSCGIRAYLEEVPVSHGDCSASSVYCWSYAATIPTLW